MIKQTCHPFHTNVTKEHKIIMAKHWMKRKLETRELFFSPKSCSLNLHNHLKKEIMGILKIIFHAKNMNYHIAFNFILHAHLLISPH